MCLLITKITVLLSVTQRPRKATKLVYGIVDMKYDDQLKRLGLVRLENRRLRSDL